MEHARQMYKRVFAVYYMCNNNNSLQTIIIITHVIHCEYTFIHLSSMLHIANQ